MPPRNIKIVYIEDSAGDRERYSGYLRRCKGIQVIPLGPPETPDARVIERYNPDIVLVDYFLHERQPGRPGVSCKGLTLSATLREKLPKVPILLVTRGNLLRRLGMVRDISGVFDELVFKDQISADPASLCDDVRVLVDGFRRLQACEVRHWSSLCDALRAKSEEKELLLQADPPKAVRENKTWQVPDVASWIRSVLVKYPGILYGSLYASVLLGITKHSFLLPSVQKWFATARYTGVFLPKEGLWWRDRLIVKAYALFHKTGMDRASLGHFRDAWKK